MSNINTRQNEPTQIERLAAQRQLYATAKRVMGTQFILSGIVGVVIAFLGLSLPDLKSYIALWGLTAVLLDVLCFTPWQKRLRESAAKAQELFDCDVLSIPWNELKVGKKIDPELIFEQARKYKTWENKMPPLSDWYPHSVQQLPLHWGAIVCQRSNCWWDSKLRRRYAAIVTAVLSILAATAVWSSLAMALTFEEFVIRVMVPFSATYVLGIRQLVEQKDAAERLDKLKAHSEKLWNDAIAGASISEMQKGSRALQDEIFDGRKRNQPIFDVFFKWLREDHENQMNRGAAELVAEAKIKLGVQ